MTAEPESGPGMLRARLPIWQALAVLAACAFLLLAPFAAWWRLAYGEFRLDLWWPLAFLGACAFFHRAGELGHRRAGEPQFFPWSARFVELLLLCLLAAMICLTASHWSRAWSVIALAAIACAVYRLALAVVAYGELWRTRCHEDVRATVVHNLGPKELVSVLEKAKARGRWGSLHGLCLLYERYEVGKRALKPRGMAAADAARAVEEAVAAGEALLLCLEQSWARSILGEPLRRWARLDTERELITICLAKGVARPGPEAWLNDLSLAQDPYHRFLLRCFESAKGAAGGGVTKASDIGKALDSARSLYGHALRLCAEAPHEFRLPVGAATGLCAIMQHTWLAVAHRGLPAQAAFDLWMDLRGDSEAFLRVSDLAAEADFALVAARAFLAEHYGRWAAATAPGWRRGLDARRELNSM